jgi:hypothetical protein
MFENETVRLVELRMLARPDRRLLARIDRMLQRLAELSASGGSADLDAVRREVDAIALQIVKLRTDRR